ncbi:MAG: DUF2202 domain-containing protein [Rubrivivax sp.]|nr:DUF2202 domain-containing protein [Rubrivivax sp.]
MNTHSTPTTTPAPTQPAPHHDPRPPSPWRRATRARLAAAGVGTAATVLLAACGGGGDSGPQGGGGGPQAAAAAQTLQVSVQALPLGSLSPGETSGLLLMREEEKLARDVYAVLYQAWGSRVFNNIGQAEQVHMDTVKLLLDRYALPDPAASTAAGQFGDPGLQGLYNSLVAAGSTSVIAALKAGAEIEDVDIRDLRLLKAATDNADMLLVYDNLERGSRNHLRAFHNNLQSLAASYTPKYLTQSAYDAIVTTPQERGAP